MTSLAQWLASRGPRPPEALSSALATLADVGAASAATSGAPTATGLDGEALHSALADLGRERLAQALGRPGRVRESAYRLLEADALFTYACEAALEAEDPVGELRAILLLAGG